MGLRSCRVESMPTNNSVGKPHEAPKRSASARQTLLIPRRRTASGDISPVASFCLATASVASHRPEYLHRDRAAVSAQALACPFVRRVCRPDPARLQGRFLWASCSHLYCRLGGSRACSSANAIRGSHVPRSRPQTRQSSAISPQTPSTTARSPPAPLS